MKNIPSCIFLFAKDYRARTSGWQGAPYFKIFGRDLVSKTGDFVQQKLGGGGGNRKERLNGL